MVGIALGLQLTKPVLELLTIPSDRVFEVEDGCCVISLLHPVTHECDGSALQVCHIQHDPREAALVLSRLIVRFSHRVHDHTQHSEVLGTL